MGAYCSNLMIKYQLEQMSQTLKHLAKKDSWLSDSTRDKLKSLSVDLDGIIYNIEEDYHYNFSTPTEQLSARLREWNKSIIK